MKLYTEENEILLKENAIRYTATVLGIETAYFSELDELMTEINRKNPKIFLLLKNFLERHEEWFEISKKHETLKEQNKITTGEDEQLIGAIERCDHARKEISKAVSAISKQKLTR